MLKDDSEIPLQQVDLEHGLERVAHFWYVEFECVTWLRQLYRVSCLRVYALLQPSMEFSQKLKICPWNQDRTDQERRPFAMTRSNWDSEQKRKQIPGLVPIAMEFIIRRWAKNMAERRLFPPASVSSDVWASANGQVPKPAA